MGWLRAVSNGTQRICKYVSRRDCTRYTSCSEERRLARNEDVSAQVSASLSYCAIKVILENTRCKGSAGQLAMMQLHKISAMMQDLLDPIVEGKIEAGSRKHLDSVASIDKHLTDWSGTGEINLLAY